MRKAKLWSCVLVGLLAFAGAAQAAEEDNPEYKMWSKYKPGTMVKTKSVTTGAPQPTYPPAAPTTTRPPTTTPAPATTHTPAPPTPIPPSPSTHRRRDPAAA